jgi:hypothetical protein
VVVLKTSQSWAVKIDKVARLEARLEVRLQNGLEVGLRDHSGIR